MLPPLLSAAGALAAASLLCLSLAAAPQWLAAAAGCYFLTKASNRPMAVTAVAVFAGLALFPWGVLFAGVLLFAALLAEGLGGAGLPKRVASLLSGMLCMMALLFAALPEISSYISAVQPPLPLILALLAAALLAEGLSVRLRPAQALLDPLLIILFAALTLCYLLAVALLAVTVAYPQAILFAAFGGCLMLAVLAVLSAPFTGGGTLTFFQHLFSLHVPVEKWVAEISAAAAEEENTAQFAATVMQRFLSLPGVVGVVWRLEGADERQIGRNARQHIDLRCAPLFIRLAMRRRALPWDWFNYYLLARICGEYCRAKQREEQHRADNLNRAVHQTGARLTHDIKNILHALTALAQAEDDALMRRQLPALCERLESTLAKLTTPSAAADERTMAAAAWWQAAQARHLHQAVAFAEAEAQGDLPPALFDLALDNFLANALSKRQTDDAVRITARLVTIAGKAALQVEDSGAAVAASTARALFARPVDSDTGFGVALYQVQLEAHKHGHAAALVHNAAGAVRFQLAAIAPSAPAAAR